MTKTIEIYFSRKKNTPQMHLFCKLWTHFVRYKFTFTFTIIITFITWM